jgi:hypothetical protein
MLFAIWLSFIFTKSLFYHSVYISGGYSSQYLFCWHHVAVSVVISSLLLLLRHRQFISLCPQSHVPVRNADCSVCIVTKICPSLWSSFIKLLMAHQLFVMTLIALFLLSVCYRLPKETHFCCVSVTVMYPTWYHQFQKQYHHNNNLHQCTVHNLVHYTYCVPKNFQLLYIRETNILSGGFILFIVLTNDWTVRSKTWVLVVFKILLYISYNFFCIIWLKFL